jgi:hypothetical protein
VALVPISSVAPTVLRWVRIQESPASFSLRADDRELAVLTWSRPGGSLATAKTAAGVWTLKRAGFLQPTILVRAEGSTEPIARLSAHLARHEITVGGGPAYRLRHLSHLIPSWRLADASGQEVLHIEPVPEKRALEAGAVVVAPPAWGPTVVLLAVLTWYFVVLSWFEDEALEALAPYEGWDPPLARGSSA